MRHASEASYVYILSGQKLIKNAILQDWKLLAQKVDYILFWVFLALTTISSCIFIFILPYFKRGKLL